ncbi:MAG: hypothetical protein PHY48_01140 [Candidatus Cloacimonetes bacterium]|nr:hypothetical protein [Candidatus Cloacimonadota bacterium]
MNRKALLLLFVVLTLSVSSVFATESRMTALGNPFGFIRDNTDISAYPGVINMYERNLRAELGTLGSDWMIGANLPCMISEGNTLGVYLNTNTQINVDNYLPVWNYYNRGDLDISKKIQMYYGFMEKFGVGFAMAIDSREKDIGDNPDKSANLSASYFEVSGGMSDEKMDIGAAITLWGAGTENDVDSDESSVGGFGFSVQGRYFVMENDAFDLVGAANLAIKSHSEEQKMTGAKNTKDESTMMFDLGAGINYKLDEKSSIIFAVKPLRLVSQGWEEKDPSGTDKGSESWMYVPTYTIGLESLIQPWLTGRVGATQHYAFHAYNDDPDGTPNTETADYQSGFSMDMGLAFKFNKFTVDTVLSKTLLHDGPNFIGGKANGLASMVSVDYNF